VNGVRGQRRFVLRAGVAFDAPGKSEESVVVPKVVRTGTPENNGWRRELYVPCGALMAHVSVANSDSGLRSNASPIALDTSLANPVEFRSCDLIGPPLGRASMTAAAGSVSTIDSRFSPWTLRRPTPLRFSVNGDALVPEEG